MTYWRCVMAAVLFAAAQAAHAFEHNHAGWDALLKRRVIVAPGGNASRVDYAAFKRDDRDLNAYLGELSAVTTADFQSWTREQRLSFLINAYNAYTVALVLMRYPAMKSIKDLGSLLQSPWNKKFFPLLDQLRSLDDIEHGMIRVPGAFDDPRIHFALNCASIGCPMLLDEAYVGARLDAQLESATRRFLSDRTRNRYDAKAGKLEISPLFDWYKADFGKDRGGAASVHQFFTRYADVVADDAAGQALVRGGQLRIRYLDYDWALNDIAR